MNDDRQEEERAREERLTKLAEECAKRPTVCACQPAVRQIVAKLRGPK